MLTLILLYGTALVVIIVLGLTVAVLVQDLRYHHWAEAAESALMVLFVTVIFVLLLIPALSL